MARTEKEIIEEYVKNMQEGFPTDFPEREEKKEIKKDKSSATTSAIKSTDETKVITQKDDTNKTATADNPLREAYRAKIKQKALEKFLPGGGDPMKMINPGSDAPPVEQPYDLLDRLAVDKRKADFRVRQQYALPVQSIGQMTQAKNGTFVTVNTKIGRNKKTRIT
jgi:hypothetical protein